MSFVTTIRREFRLIRRRKVLIGLTVVLPLALIAILAFAFRSGVATDLPVAVVDLDRSTLSREVVRMLDATPDVAVVVHSPNLAEARSLIVSGAARGALLLPAGFERDALRGARPEAVIFYDNQHMSAGSVVARGARNAVSAAMVGLGIALREAQGAGALQAAAAAQPVPLQTHALFNPGLDYVDFLLAALVPAVIQLMAAAATTYSVSLDFGPGRHARVLPRMAGGLLPAMLGKLLPYTFLFMLLLGLADIGLYGALEVPLRGSLLLMGVGAVLFILASQLIGALCFLLTRSFARAISFVAVILAPALGYMGIGFPREAMPPLAQAWSSLLPGTWYVQLRIDQSLRATPMDLSVWPVLYLLAMVVVLGLIVLLRLDQMRATTNPDPQGARASP
ncbi:MAG TPA: ABC transporter permease [Paracoccaceae bacterium]|nr:ABC transporter permease [Paracoccaceae bacterium]